MTECKCSAVSLRLARSAWLVAGVLAGACGAFACDTPVYEYAMQHWQRDIYQVRYFHDGEQASADAQANEHLRRVASGAEGHANLGFASVDVTKLDATTPHGHRQTWARHKSHELPFHVITSPRGAELFVGRLDAATSRMMVGSPKRRALAEQLSQGKQGVLLTLLGPDQEENAAAQRAVADVVARAKGEDLDVGVMKIARDDAQERWLVRQLLGVEDDLKDLAKTMVFGAFGRGYVLPPYLGNGITERNLAELVAFINGPCGCEIKASNPGVDLLTDWNWEAHLADWATSDSATPGFMLFDIKEEASAEPVIQMPVLSHTDTASEPAGETQAAAGSSAKAEEQQPHKEGHERADQPAGEAESSGPGEASGEEQGSATPADAAQEPPTDEHKNAEATGAESNADPDAEAAQARGESSGPKLPVRRVPPRPTDDELEAEQGASLGSALSLRLALTLGGAAILAVAGGLLVARRGRES